VTISSRDLAGIDAPVPSPSYAAPTYTAPTYTAPTYTVQAELAPGLHG